MRGLKDIAFAHICSHEWAVLVASHAGKPLVEHGTGNGEWHVGDALLNGICLELPGIDNAEADAHMRLFRVAENHFVCAHICRGADGRSGGRSAGVCHAAEMLFHLFQHVLRLEIAGYHHCHPARQVVVAVELPHLFAGNVADDFLQADGHELRHARPVAQETQRGDEGAVALGVTGFQLADDNATLVVDGFIRQRGAVGKVSHDGERRVNGLLIQLR